MSYARSAATRQAILDYLHAHPLQSAKQLSDVIIATRNSVQGCVKFMADRREVEKIGNGKSTRYRARVKTTISAEQVIKEMREKRQEAGVKPVEHGKTIRPSYYRQRGGDWAAESGGGQGALRRQFTIQASAGML